MEKYETDLDNPAILNELIFSNLFKTKLTSLFMSASNSRALGSVICSRYKKIRESADRTTPGNLSSFPSAHVDPCFHVYAQKSLFIGENGNPF